MNYPKKKKKKQSKKGGEKKKVNKFHSQQHQKNTILRTKHNERDQRLIWLKSPQNIDEKIEEGTNKCKDIPYSHIRRNCC